MSLSERMVTVQVKVPLEVSDLELVRIGASNPGWKVERIGGTVVMSPPAGFESGRREDALASILRIWGKENGYLSFSPSTGFSAGAHDTLSPDAALVKQERYAGLTAQAREHFAPFAPDIAAEIASPSDAIGDVRKKCERWYELGASYVLFFDPFKQTVETWGDAPQGFPDDWHEVFEAAA